MKKYDKFFNEIEIELKGINSEVGKWSLAYLSSHKNRYRSDLEIIEVYYKNGRILEVGALPCHMTYCLKKMNYPVVSLDINPKRMQKFIEKHKLNVIKCNIEENKLPFDDNTFGLILFNELFEHLRIDPIFTLKEINRVLKPDGVMVLTTPNLYSLTRIISFNIGRGFGNPYKEFMKLHDLGHTGHVREYSTEEIRQFLENTGYKVVDVKYKSYNKRKGLLSLLNLIHYAIPTLRPFQVIINKKAI